MKRFRLNWKVILILLGIVLLRIPSFFEPYWYGDEGIYFVMGQAMQRGAVLYRDIWDNKPPLLYLIYAISPTIIWAKLTATVCVLGTVSVVYAFTKKSWPTILTGILLSLPYPILEGTIANAELYFILPTIISAFIFWYLIEKKVSPRKYLIFFLTIGFLFTISFLLKVPAVFDFGGMFFATYIFLLSEAERFSLRDTINRTFLYLKNFIIPIIIPFALTLLPIIFYFYLNHALTDFVTASFGQNASYVAVGSGPLAKLSNPLFVKALILLLSLLVLVVFFWKKKVSKQIFFLFSWFGFSLYGALLSNRPYPHYLLQIVPPCILLIFFLLKSPRKNLIFILFLSILLINAARPFSGFVVSPLPYYQNFIAYSSEQKTREEYANFFDAATINNYKIADYISSKSNYNEPIFVWGDNAFIYVLSNRPPATKFIQSHHLTTIPVKNYDLIMERLNKYQPKFVVVSRPTHFEFKQLEDFLKKNYVLDKSFDNWYVYRNVKQTKLQTFDIHYH